MPIITIEFIQDVVATKEQKRELIVRLTDVFCNILGDVVRPFVYTIIEETPQQEWGIAGVPMPDLAYLTGEKHARVIARSNELMRAAIGGAQPREAPAQSPPAPAAGGRPASQGADGRGEAEDRRTFFAQWFEELWKVVATPQQKHELVMRLTNTFVDSLADVVRPYVSALIGEAPQEPTDEAKLIEKSGELARGAAAAKGPVTDESADRAWRGAK